MKILPNAKLPIPRYREVRTGKTLVHLHWLWKQGPSALHGVTSAVALCGAKQLPRALVTAHPEDTTCRRCKGKATQ